MTPGTSLLFALTAYGLAAIISFLVALVIKGMSIAIRRLERAPAPAVPMTEAPPTVVSSSAVPPEVAVVIASAVATMLQQPFQIRRISYQGGRRDAIWTRQGRISVMESHRMRTR